MEDAEGFEPPIVRPATGDDLETIVGWLREPRIARWLDFGPGGAPDVLALKYGVARGRERLFMFSTHGDHPVGVVGLSQIHPRFKTAMVWYALGDHCYAGRGLTRRAVAQVLAATFSDLELQAINAWTVAGNLASQRVLEKNGFRLIGRQRRCHGVDGEFRDRLLFDILVPADGDPGFGRPLDEE